MRLPFIASTLVALALIACSGPRESGSGTGLENTPSETRASAEPLPTAASVTPNSSENTLIETLEYTGVIISKKGASEFRYMFDEATTRFWEPSISDVSRAEKCIKQFLVSAQNDPGLDTYQQENAAFILDNLEEYRRQYVGIVVDGEKRIWCNSFFFDDSFPDWMHLPVDVDDGGKHFWQIEYDVLKDECINFYIHGEA